MAVRIWRDTVTSSDVMSAYRTANGFYLEAHGDIEKVYGSQPILLSIVLILAICFR